MSLIPNTFIIIFNILLQYTPLGSIFLNYFLQKYFSLYARGVIARKASKGTTPTKITKDLKISRETMRRTIQLSSIRNEGKSLPKAARKKSYTDLEE